MTVKKLLTVFLICFLSLLTQWLPAQNKPGDYTAEWVFIDSLANKKGLPREALDRVNNLYSRAKKEHNEAQVLKTLIYRMELGTELQEDALVENISALEKELPDSPQPGRAILMSLLAESYWNYFQQNRYKLYDRTAVSGAGNGPQSDEAVAGGREPNMELPTWSRQALNKRISDLYLASLADEKALQQTGLEPFDAIIIKGNSRRLRPTLFDLLAHRALAYFKNNESTVDQPGRAFEIADPAAFADKAAFAGYRFTSTDSLSLPYKALLLFQTLIRLHLADKDPSALLDVDIERIGFMNQSAVMEEKDSLYRRALEHITTEYGAEPLAAQAWFLQAEELNTLAEEYDPHGDTTGRYLKAKALYICDRVLHQKEESEGWSNCMNLRRRILGRELHLQTEKVNTPGQPFRSLVNYRNLSQVWFRIVKMDRAQRELLNRNEGDEGYWQKLVRLPSLRNFSQRLPVTGDYLSHRTEIKIDALPVGEYALLVSDSGSFQVGDRLLSVQYFYVSGLASIHYGNNYFVLDRESGQPVANANVRFWYPSYDYQKSRNSLTAGETYITDARGHFIAQKQKERRNDPLLEINVPGDHLFISQPDQMYTDYRQEEEQVNEGEKGRQEYEKKHRRIFFFMDRSIYRPGQEIFFKGIVVTRDAVSHLAKICPGMSRKVILYNANGERTDSLSLQTDEFGSIHGRFRLPENLLNGSFRLQDDSTGSGQAFSVEEYKRPLFHVDLEKPANQYRLNDTIRVTGKALAYAGNALDGAGVVYRVTRSVRTFYSWRPRGIMNRGRTGEIAHGTLQTRADGSFVIAFPAIPDRSVPKGTDPVFEYTLSADVTDINGETRSEEITLPAGYHTLQVNLSMRGGDAQSSDSLHIINVKSSNLSGQTQDTLVNLAVYALKPPDRLIRTRYWEAPDQFVMSREEYIRFFPRDEYQDETMKERWEKEEKPRYASQADTRKLKEFTLPKNIGEGWWLVKASALDKDGELVTDSAYLEIYAGKTGLPPNPQYSWWGNNRETAEPGDRVALQTGTSANGVFVIQKTERPEQGKGSDGNGFEFLTLDRNSHSTSFAVSENDRGGFGVFRAFVKDNRIYTASSTIDVPWSNKELEIQYNTYRDKTLPGSEEQWQVTVSGNKGDKVAAQMVAGMYDASLDQFSPHAWQAPTLFPMFGANKNWNGGLHFEAASSEDRYIPENYLPGFTKSYDQLLSLEQERVYMAFSTGRVRRGGQGMMIAKMAAPEAAQGIIANYTTSGEMFVQGKRIKKSSDNETEKPDEADQNEPGGGEENAPPAGANTPVQVRKNFNETAFFFPDLRTDSAGRIRFSFTMPEALTSWKWMSLAHTKELAFGYSEKTIVTQKTLMVQPNAPRFLREGDHIELSAKIVNLSDSELTGQVELQLSDAAGNQPAGGPSVDGWFSNRQASQFFTVGPGQSVSVEFPLDIPYQFNRPVNYRIVAKAKSFSDGEENVLPVLSNRILVTESIPLTMRGNGSRNFRLEGLLKSGGSETLNHHALTVEYTSNPAWYAVQALPYLIEYPYECAEQTFERYYANALAGHIVRSIPKMRAVFDRWKTADTAALLSNLQKNPELKSVLLEETPWVLEAKSEAEQHRNIALLFDMTRMARELGTALGKLQEMQAPNGGFVWFKGGPDDRYITQVILSGIGHLAKLKALPAGDAEKIKAIVQSGLSYLDKKIQADYERWLREQKKETGAAKNGADGGKNETGGGKSGAGGKAATGGKNGNGKKTGGGGEIKIPGGIDYSQIQYLYMRSLFPDYDIPGSVFPAMNFYRKQARQNWVGQNPYLQGMTALALFRTGDVQTAKDIMRSLQDRAINSDDLGMYWKEMQGGYYWHQAPIEAEALLIEAFREITGNGTIDGNLKTWLLQQKQTQSWPTTKSTADACYALLLGGAGWLTEEKKVEIRLGDKLVISSDASGWSAASGASGTSGVPGEGAGKEPGKAGTEAGTGYFKKTIEGKLVQASMGNITVTVSGTPGKPGVAMKPAVGADKGTAKPAAAGKALGAKGTGEPAGSTTGGSGVSWGAAYWQYFENADKVGVAESGNGTGTNAKLPLQLTKKLFIQKNTDRGPVLEPLQDKAELRVGDKLIVRIELRSDRDLEYVHMKDMRASCMEPVNVLSQYKWQGGLGYYESTKDASTNFFFDRIPRGAYVFEYPLFVSQAGHFSNGLTTIQCMYAPQFGSHSEGIRVSVERREKP